MAKTGNKRTPQQLEADRAQVAVWYCQGKTQVWMGAQLGLSQQQISYDLKAIRKEWAANYIDFGEAKERELAKIDHLELTYWEAWKRSCEDAELERQKQTGTKDAPSRVEVTKEKRGQAGDPRFLAGVERCIKMRREMLGLDAPDKLALTDPTGEHPYVGYDIEQRATEIATVFAAAREAEATRSGDTEA